MQKNFLISFIFIFFFLIPAKSENISGEVTIIDGDTIKIDNKKVIYWQSAPFSARFYTKGKASIVQELDALQKMLLNEYPILIAVKHKQAYRISPVLAEKCQFAAVMKNQIFE